MKKKLTPFNGLWIKGERRGTGLLTVSRLLRSARTAGKGRSTTCRTTAFSVTVARNATPNFPTRRTQFVERNLCVVFPDVLDLATGTK